MKLTLKRCLSALICFAMLTGGVPAFMEESATPAPEPVQETAVPTAEPTEAPIEAPTEEPTEAPTEEPTEEPTEAPTEAPTEEPTEAPTEEPTEEPTEAPTDAPTEAPTEEPTEAPTEEPSVSPSPEATLSPEELLAAEVEAWVSGVSGEADEYEKAFLLYKKLIAAAAPGEGSTATDALLNLSADDEGYALALEALLDAAGIDCRTIEGESCWNIAEIDGEWTHIDAYADDKSGETGRHFGLSDAAMLRDHEWNAGAYPSAEGSKNNYYVREKDYIGFDSADSLRAILSEAIETETVALCLYNAAGEGSAEGDITGILSEIAPEVAPDMNEDGFLIQLSLCYPSGIMMAAPLILPTGIEAEAATLTLGLYEKYSIADFWKFVPEGSTDIVSYSSSSASYVSVNEDGLLYGRRIGSSTITITAASGVSCSIKVSVKKAPTSVKGTAERYTIGVGESMQLGHKLSSGSAGQVRFTTADASIASITEDGLIKGVAPGAVKITVASYNGKKASGTFTVVPEPTDIILSRESVSIGAKDSWVLDAALNDGAVGSITFSSSDETIATVDAEGRISALKEGNAVITAETYNGVSKACAVTVVPEPTDVILTAPYTTIGVGEKLQLEASMLPGEALGTMKFASQNTRYATVNQEGIVTGKRAGSTDITVTSYNGLTETIRVTVKSAPKSVSGVIDRKVLGVGETMQVGYKLNSGAAGQVSFSTGNESIATIAQDGTLTAVAPGNVSITIKAYNNVKRSTTITVKEAPTDIILSRESVSIGAKDSWVLDAKVNDGAAGNVNFSSSDETVATVDSEGRISALKEGNAVITAETYNGVSKACAVTVVPEPTDVILTAPYTTIGVGEKLQLEASMLPGEALGTMKFASQSTRYATVNQEGIVTGKRAGSTDITVTSYNGLTETIRVTVKSAPKSVSGVIDRKVLGVGETMQVGYKLNSGAAGQVSFSTGNESIATIAQDGTLTAVAPGNVSITIKAYNNVKRSTTITIKEAPTDIILSRESVSIGAKDSWVLDARVNDGAAGIVTFSSSDETVATVDSEGRISALKEGTAVITASTYNDVSRTCAVTVVPEPTDVILTAPYTTIGVGEKLQLEASMLPGEALGTMKFASQSTRYATVNQEGIVTGKRAGSTDITVTSYNGLTETIRVTVKSAPKSVSGIIDRKVLGVGETMQVGYKLNSGAAGQVSFSTGNESIATIAQDGTLTAVAPGNVSITIKAYNNIKRSTTITIKEAPTDIAFDTAPAALGVGEEVPFTAILNEGSAGKIRYYSENPEIAAIDEDSGYVTAIAPGTTLLRAETYVPGLAATFALEVKPAPTTITLMDNPMYIAVGETVQLDPIIDEGAQTSFRYSSSNSRYTKVNSAGEVRSTRTGTYYITIKTHNDLSCKLKLIVRKAPGSISLKPALMDMGVGQKYRLSGAMPSGTASTLTWESLTPDIVSVDKYGVVTALKTGEASVKVSTFNGHSSTNSILVHEAPTSMSLSAPELLGVGLRGTTVLTLDPEGSYTLPEYSVVSGDAVAIDEAGVIYAVAPGEAVVRAASHVDGLYADTTVTVLPAPTYISFPETEYIVYLGETLQLTPEIDEGSFTRLSYTASSASYFTIDENGLVTPLRHGSATVTVKTHNGLSTRIKLRVIDPNFPEAIYLASEPPQYLELEDTYTPVIEVFPATAIADIRWTSSSSAIASVDEITGEVTANSYGRAVITGVSDRNPTLSVSYTIIVLSPVRCLKVPTRRLSSTSGISSTLSMIKNVRASAYLELETLYLQGTISKSDYSARKGYIERAFDMHLMPWMTETKEYYWKAANSENGAKDYKPGIVYFGLPYTQTNRVNSRTSAVAAGYYTNTGKGYYLMNGSKFASRNYPGNDCSSFASIAVWGMDSSRRRDNTRTIASASYYTTLSDWEDLRPGDLLNKGGSHVVMFLYYTNAAKTQFMIIEQGGGEAGTNTISCSIRDVSYYTSRNYKIRRVSSLGR